MNTRRTALTTLLILAGLLLAACGSTTPTPDVEAAVETAIAQTRTFETAVAQSAAATVTLKSLSKLSEFVSTTCIFRLL